MYDVAALAGVSHQTVSRVLNEPLTVRATTRARVLKAIEELGYQRNMSARALATSRSRVIGVVTTGSFLYGPSSTLNAIEVAARKTGYATLVSVLEGGSHEAISAAFAHLEGRGVEGVVVIAPQTWVVQAIQGVATRMPVVLATSGLSEVGDAHLVAVDQELGARLAVRHLLGLGKRNIVHVAGPVDWFDARARIDGWRGELRDAGMEVEEPLLGTWTAGGGYEIGVRLAAGDIPDAIFAANDLMALGLLRAFAERGIRVPDDVSLVGFDDMPGADFFNPSLTTVRQPFEDLGTLCLDVLITALTGGGDSVSTIPPTLVIRESA